MDQLMVKVGDAELECFSHGDGVAIVMLPGGSLTVDYLSDLAEAVAGAGFRAIRVNPRGAGTSTGPTDGLTLHDFAGDVAGVIAVTDPDTTIDMYMGSGGAPEGVLAAAALWGLGPAVLAGILAGVAAVDDLQGRIGAAGRRQGDDEPRPRLLVRRQVRGPGSPWFMRL